MSASRNCPYCADDVLRMNSSNFVFLSCLPVRALISSSSCSSRTSYCSRTLKRVPSTSISSTRNVWWSISVWRWAGSHTASVRCTQEETRNLLDFDNTTFNLPIVQQCQYYSKLLPIRHIDTVQRISYLTKIEGSNNTLLRNIYEFAMDNNSIISNLSEKYHCSNTEFVKYYESVDKTTEYNWGRLPMIIYIYLTSSKCRWTFTVSLY